MDKRPISGKSQRYQLAKKKYEMFQNKQDQLQEMDNILTGKQKETIVPKPGEFVIVSTDKKVDPSDELSLGLDDLLDSARQTIQNRLQSARKSSRHKIVRQSAQISGKAPQMMTSQKGEDQLLASISSQPMRRFTTDQTKQQSQILSSQRDEGVYQDNQLELIKSNYQDQSRTKSKNELSQHKQQLEAFDEQIKEQQILQNESKSTLDMLQDKLVAQQSSRQQPIMLPSLSISTPGVLNDKNQSHISQSQSMKTLSRPGSAYVLFKGDKEQLQQAKSRLNLKDSRQRDIIRPSNHSYKPQPQKYQLEKVRNPSLAAHAKAPILPSLVQHQQSMLKDLDPTSPFMYERIMQPIIVREENPRVTHSPVFDVIYKEIDERLKNRDSSPSRYTYSIDQIKILRQSSGSPQKKQLKQSMKKMNIIKDKIQKGLTESDLKILSKKFLPVDAYDPMMDVENPVAIIEQYQDLQTGKVLAKSKWFFGNGESEMRACEVLRYLNEEELYEIKWINNNSIKKVSRFNLVFDKEDQELYKKRIEEARHHREYAEIIMKYYYLVQNIKCPNYEMSDDEKTRVSYYINSFDSSININGKKFRNPLDFLQREAKERYEIPLSLTQSKRVPQFAVEDVHKEFIRRRYNLETLANTFKELDFDYQRCHKQIIFDSQLPYSTEKYNLFKSILPQTKFIPVSERIIGESSQQGLIKIPERSQKFIDLLGTMSQKLHQANQVKLDSLMRVNQNMIRFAPMNFFRLQYRSPHSLEMFIKTNRLQSSEVVREVRNCMFDSQYEIHSMIASEAKKINEINAQRKKASSYQSKQFKEEAFSKQFINDMSQFQILLNMLYERAIRTCYENSVQKFNESLDYLTSCTSGSIGRDINQDEVNEQDLLILAQDAILAKRLENSYQLKIKITFNKESGQIQLSPTTEQWLADIATLVKHSVEEISYVPCFSANEIGSAREDGKVHIFEQNDLYVENSKQNIKNKLLNLFKVPLTVERALHPYGYIMAIDIKRFKHQYKNNDYPVEKYKQELENYQHAMLHIEKLLFEDKLNVGLFQIKSEKLKKQFRTRINELNIVLFQCIKKKIDQTNQAIEAEVEYILGIINKEPIRDIEELTEISQFLDNLDKKMLCIKGLISDVMSKMSLLEDYQYKMLEEEFTRTWVSFSKPLEIFRAEASCRRRIKRDEREFFQDLRLMNEKLVKDFDEIKIDFDILQRSEELTEYEDSVTKCDYLLEKLERALAIAEVSNRREDLFKLKKTDFIEIEQLKATFMPYNTVWNLAREYFYKINTWMNGPLSEFDRDKIATEITEACQTLMKLEKVEFKDRRATGQVCADLRKFYESFKPFLPLIIALRNPSLKMRHWENIQRLKNPQFDIDAELHHSIQELIEKGVFEFIEDINDISDCASREKKLEDGIIKMRDEWKHIKFELVEFRESGTYVIKGAEPIWDLLDEHIMKTMSIASSPYIKFLQGDVNYWKQTLIKVQEVLEEWTKVQRGWLYLWPIFSSEDIQRQMPIISASFQTVDKIWRNIMQNTHLNANVLDACTQSRVFENFTSCNEMIDRIQKGLNEYLNTKRMAFPRFFFLSNDDLLHILSQTKDPLRVQDHLNKCFEGIDKLEFDSIKKIQGMYSQMGEHIKFVTEVDPFNRENNEVRNVEEWLSEVEAQMRISLKDLMLKGLTAYSVETRQSWVFQWPQQIVLTLDQVIWTKAVEEEGIKAMNSQDGNSMKKVFKKEEIKLQELVTLIKTPRDSQIDLLTLGALIVLDVHSKDVTKELIIQQVDNIADFEWISQLRYYIYEETPAKGKDSTLEIDVKMVNSTRLYGFEYLGNQTRLVITPLTDRCYRTLMGALQLYLGGAPEGPAGTGKTETTKDLAKAVAKQCIVFNCSDQLNVEGMAKFFKGLACCGAWACFDEFNRIELEVLSVIAQQILTIQSALMRRRPATAFQFEDETITMNPTCAVFITMNPGYAGRSELPDNLKALFRPVAMMIPNYAMIAEISLYSFGFQNARELSVKITQSLILASEQLSTQSHYDYGMRAVKSIILAAGSLKTIYPIEDEYQLVLRAISDCNIPKFISEDVPLFEGIISDLFPTASKLKPDYDVLQKAIKETIQNRSLEENEEFEIKTIQLFETVQVRHGLMMVGQIMSSKTEVIHTLAEALSLVNKNKLSNDSFMSHDLNESNFSQTSQKASGEDIQNKAIKLSESVKINTINPKSISIGQLYGDFDKISHDWSDGVLATIIKECATDKTGNNRWILMDGPVDAVWIENLNTVLDDNKKLCLSSGEIVKFTSKMTMMFEVEDLLEASPATVSRCGMVYLNPEKLGWQVLMLPWISSLPNSLKSEGRQVFYRDLIQYFIPKVIGYIFGYDQTLEEERRLQSLKTVVQVTKNWTFRSFISLFESLLLKSDTRQSLHIKEQETRDKEEAKKAYEQLQGLTKVDTLNRRNTRMEEKKMTPEHRTEIFSLFIMALTWSFGAPLHEGGRYLLNEFLQQQVQQIFAEPSLIMHGDELYRKMVLDESSDYFSSFFHIQRQEWLKWDYELSKYNIFGFQMEQSETLTDNFTAQDEVKVEFQSILVPTEDTIRYSYILNALVSHSFPVLFVGETGTGKTLAIKKFAIDKLTKDEWETGQMVLSATSTAHNVQEYLQGRVEKQKKGVYGPKQPGHRLFIFIDDLNMPAKEKYGAQPPIEMLRQTIDNGGYYDLKTNEWHKIIDVLFVAAMGIPGGGKTLPTKRLLRHFNLIHLTPFTKDNLYTIFSKILEWGYKNYPETWFRQVKNITKLTIAIYENSVKVLLPLPSKSHYLFNLRQVSEIVQGLLMVPPEVVERSNDQAGLLQRLWIHECMRVFADRLIDQEDKNLFLKTLKETIQTGAQQKFIDIDQAINNPEYIIFNNFVQFNPNDPQYNEVRSIQATKDTIMEIMEYYNQMQKDKLNLLLFDYVIQHLSRVCRIIFKPYGNGMLIGLGGNGRRSLSKLAAFINECQVFKIEITKSYGRNEWQDDLKALYKTLGLDNKKVVFTLADSEIKQEYFIEDINNILNVGEVPNLYNNEEIEEIIHDISKQGAKLKNGDPPFEVFIKKCKKNLHIILFMSPAGDKLRQYIRQYPSLVNCTSIDWFLPWPEEALLTVSEHFLSESGLFEVKQPTKVKRLKEKNQTIDNVIALEEMQIDVDTQKQVDKSNNDLAFSEINENKITVLQQEYESVELPLSMEDQAFNNQILAQQAKVSQIFVQIHCSALNLANKYLVDKNRQVYITPTRFIEIFKLFGIIMNRKHHQLDEERQKYLIGIQKLEEANIMVDEMKEQLESLKPVLEEKSKQVEHTMLYLDKESKEVEAVKVVVDREAQIVASQKEIAESIKNECLVRLSEAQPQLDEALKALKTLKASDFVTIKSYNSPPYLIKMTLEAVCIMQGVKPLMIEIQGKGTAKKKVPDYWEKSKKLLSDPKKLMQSLENYDKDNIADEINSKIQIYLDNPKFQPEEIKKASEAAEGLCKWVRAICKYDVVAKEIKPKRQALGEAQETLNIVAAQLQEKQDQLQKIIDKKAQLEDEFKNQNFEKQNLIMQRDECQAKLSRASILMNSLGNEKQRWLKTSQRLFREKQSLLGDIIISASFVTYLGPFEGFYRETIIKQEWQKLIIVSGIAVGESFSLRDVIGIQGQQQMWQLKGIPSDNVSFENMIIMEETKDKWPLIIDPQGQALRFLKDMLEQQFTQIKLSSDNYAKKLEPALLGGATVICENVGQSIDPAINSIVCKEIYEIQGDKYIKFNDNQVEYSDSFRFYMVSNLANPHFSPELQTKTRVLNFSVTKQGLEQQLLSMICRNENARDEDERDRLQRQNVEFKEQKRSIEDQILAQLREAGQDILDDDSLVNSLNESKKITDDIKQKLKTARHIEERIEENRKNYKPVAEHVAKLYFCVQELPALDPMYQFSMNWFRELLEKSFSYSEKVRDIKGRIKQLKVDFMMVLYKNVCRSLFEHHKLMFAFSMAIKVFEEDLTQTDFMSKLRELEQLNVGTSAIASQFGGNQVTALSQQSKNPHSIEMKSDRLSVAGGLNNLAQQLAQKNEEERLKIPKDELKYLLTGLIPPDEEREERNNPVESFLDNKIWEQVLDLSVLYHFENLPDEIEKCPVLWRDFIQSSSQLVPEPLLSQLPDFAMILLHKVLKPELTVVMIQNYIEKALGSFFVKPIVNSLDETFQDSKPHVPLILILTPGNDPMEQIKKFGEEKSRMPYPVSLGKGQGEKAKALINEIKYYGGWVVLQNCHLATSFLPELEQIFENLQPQIVSISRKQADSDSNNEKVNKPPHPDFRLWLTSMSTNLFPFSVLQSSIKLTSEPPKSLKSSLLRSYQQIESSKTEKEFFQSSNDPKKWRPLFLALSFFHAVVRERRRYGPLGWNLNYDFNDSDFRISMRQLHQMIDTFDQVPFKALCYLTGECNYGGRVTDDWDRRTLSTILKDFYNRKSLKSDFRFSNGLIEYYIKQIGELEDYQEYIFQLPDTESPLLVGLHSNASISQAINDSSRIIQDVLALSKNAAVDTQNSAQTQQAIKIATEILYQIREPFKIKEVEKVFPFKYEESMNSVLLQELARFNVLVETVKSSLYTLIKTLEGKIVMTADIEQMLKSVTSNSVPEIWRKKSYPSRKPLISYIRDLQERLKMLENWIQLGQPQQFWISGFFFTQSFLTGVKQNFARKYKYPIDRVIFRFLVLKYSSEVIKAPEDGCYVRGLFLEGAGWNDKIGVLEESAQKVLQLEMPCMHFLPVLQEEESLDKPLTIIKKYESDQSGESEEDEDNSLKDTNVKNLYACPVYKTSARSGTLSTTGHSTNYILTTHLPSNEKEDFWIKRSVALLSQLDY